MMTELRQRGNSNCRWNVTRRRQKQSSTAAKGGILIVERGISN
jgi:hypothetical protein